MDPYRNALLRVALALTLMHCSLGISKLISLSNWKTLTSKTACQDVPYLASQQVVFCKSEPKVLLYLQRGVQMAMMECQHQFKNERWNCSTKSFQALSSAASKETAFIHAIASAAITHTITKACSAGNITRCACATPSKGEQTRIKREEDMEPWPQEWVWGGCSDDIQKGMEISKLLVNAEEELTQESSRDTRSLMNIHNYEAGRKTVSSLMKTQCRCHGVSGACAVRTCWRELSAFQVVGGELKKMYDSAAIKVASRGSSRGQAKKLRPADKSMSKRSLRQQTLVFMKMSSDFCSSYPEQGIYGVKDRQCNKTSQKVDGCGTLCCGRGYNTQILEEQERCHCKFHWCCHVSCKTCYYSKEVYTCK